MATSFLGAGIAPAGTSFAGFGSPATATVPAAPAPDACRKIDYQTKDYLIDDDGNLEQWTAAQQNVYLALAGISNWPETIDENYASAVASKIDAALSAMTSAGLIELIQVDVTITRRGSARTHANVRWRDLSTGSEWTNGI